jgi:hypothetical protein
MNGFFFLKKICTFFKPKEIYKNKKYKKLGGHKCNHKISRKGYYNVNKQQKWYKNSIGQKSNE